MTAPASAARPGPWVFRLAHYQPWIVLVMVVANIADHLAPSPGSDLAAVLTLGLVAAAMVSSWRHSRSLCLLCVSDIPMDPTTAARETHRGRLRAFHLTADRPYLATAAILAGIGVSFWWFWAFAMVWTWLAVEAYAGHWHRLLEPWCPWCRPGGGGHEDLSPDSGPDPSLPADPRTVTR